MKNEEEEESCFLNEESKQSSELPITRSFDIEADFEKKRQRKKSKEDDEDDGDDVSSMMGHYEIEEESLTHDQKNTIV